MIHVRFTISFIIKNYYRVLKKVKPKGSSLESRFINPDNLDSNTVLNSKLRIYKIWMWEAVKEQIKSGNC
jgi:hypothetical protein